MRISDWRSDVCSSDLCTRICRSVETNGPAGATACQKRSADKSRRCRREPARHPAAARRLSTTSGRFRHSGAGSVRGGCRRRVRGGPNDNRWEGSRVGKEGGSTCRSGGAPHLKKKKKK